jgi:hypothetical protein
MKAPRDFPHHIFAIGQGGLIESPLKVWKLQQQKDNVRYSLD